ncbi:unknown [Feldmannia species virus]|uniref:Uncharacterized protein n=1 Tax=Feldmannia species virus TaxID=39420 RepID=B5LWL7_9PHYC|nr:hypothetical protein FeldSpV_gp128 [Feldmannia species virus]ACH46880.1 unknown [Feldmannia species virus]
MSSLGNRVLVAACVGAMLLATAIYFGTESLTSESGIDIVTSRLTDSVEQTLSEYSWESMFEKFSDIIEEFARRTEDVPTLLSIDIGDQIQRVSDWAERSFGDLIETLLVSREDRVLLAIDLALVNLGSDLRVEVDTDKLFTVIISASDSRITKLTRLFENVKEWQLEAFVRFLRHVSRIRAELNVNSNLETWIRQETQTIFVSNSFKLGGPISDHFETRLSLVSNILVSQSSRNLVARVSAVQNDPVIGATQKRRLTAFAHERKAGVESQDDTAVLDRDYTLAELATYYEPYSSRLANELRVITEVISLEYSAIQFRAESEGRLTCIVQFYEMRRTTDYAFLFEFCKDRDFDLDIFKKDVYALLEDTVTAPEISGQILALTDLGHLKYLYEEAGAFLRGRAYLFFQDDDIVLAAMLEHLAKTHDTVSSVVPDRIMYGISGELAEEQSTTLHFLRQRVEAFVSIMEYSKFVELIKGSRSSVIDAVVKKISEISNELKGLPAEFISEAIAPFTFERFESSSQQFELGDDIDYPGMKAHVISETNSYASQILVDTRDDYVEKIRTVSDLVTAYINSISLDLKALMKASEFLEPESKDELIAMVEDVVDGYMLSWTKTEMDSLVNDLETYLFYGFTELEVVQDQRLQNFFNTKIQVIKDSFRSETVGKLQSAYVAHVDAVEASLKGLSRSARVLFRELFDEFLSIEISYRSKIAEVAGPVLQDMTVQILADYNIVSFSNRAPLVVNEMKSAVNSAALDVLVERNREILAYRRKYDAARTDFTELILNTGNDLKLGFRETLRQELKNAKERGTQIMGHLLELFDLLERTLFDMLADASTNLVDEFVNTPTNGLPDTMSLETITYESEFMSLASTDDDAIVLPAAAFQREHGIPRQIDEFGNYDSEVDEPSGLSTIELKTYLVDWDLWINSKITELVQEAVIAMEDSLVQNTCRNNKPPCRDGWVQFENNWEVQCCSFDPASQGRQGWEVALLFGKEIALALALDVERVVTSPKKLKSAATFMAENAAKGQRAIANSFHKYGGKSAKRMTKAISLSGKMGGKSVREGAKRFSQVLTSKVVASQTFKTGSKFLTKLSLGPAGVALMIFDTVSLVLDLWDPAGYNEEQSAGILRVGRDELEKNWRTMLKENGFEHPVLADPMFDKSPEAQTAFMEEVFGEWFSDKLSTFITVNESRHELLPDSEVLAEIEQKESEIYLESEEDPNLLANLMVSKLRNVRLQDISVRESYSNPHTDGGPDSDRNQSLFASEKSRTGLMEMVLDEEGCRAFNIFHAKKAAFLNSFKFNPYYRFTKRDHNYMITLDSTTVPKFLETGTQCFVTQTMSQYESSDSVWGSGEYVTVPGETCVGLVMPPIIPTLEGSLELAEWFSSLSEYEALASEIRERVSEGWTFVEVDGEEEFWIQYDPEMDIFELTDRTRYQAKHEENARLGAHQYTRLVDTVLAAHIDSITPDSEPAIRFDDVKIAYLASFPENWEGSVFRYPLHDFVADIEKDEYTVQTLPVIPEWVPGYNELLDTYEPEVEAEFERIHQENVETLRTHALEAHQAELDRLETKASENNKSVEDIRKEEAAQGRSTDPNPPEFAVFLHGFGVVSPLYTIKAQCSELGVDYDKERGLCSFTPAYCNRYGTDHFFNKDLGVYDCELPRSAWASEYLFGTTVTRSTRRGWKALFA